MSEPIIQYSSLCWPITLVPGNFNNSCLLFWKSELVRTVHFYNKIVNILNFSFWFYVVDGCLKDEEEEYLESVIFHHRMNSKSEFDKQNHFKSIPVSHSMDNEYMFIHYIFGICLQFFQFSLTIYRDLYFIHKLITNKDLLCLNSLKVCKRFAERIVGP